MAETTKNVESQKPFTAKDFEKGYRDLCVKMGFQIVVTPTWKARDDGTWSMLQTVSIGELPKQQ